MQITIELPDDIANQLQLHPVSFSQRVLELIAADNYRQGRIGAAEVRRISQARKNLSTLHRR